MIRARRVSSLTCRPPPGAGRGRARRAPAGRGGARAMRRSRVGAQPADRGGRHVLAEAVEHGDPVADHRIQERLGPAPVGQEEPVGAVVRDRHGLDPRSAEVTGDVLDGHARQIRELGQVLLDRPIGIRQIRVEREDDGAPCDARQLARPPARSDQWWSERTAIAASNDASANGSAAASASIASTRPGRPLGAHDRRRLDRGDIAVARARSCPSRPRRSAPSARRRAPPGSAPRCAGRPGGSRCRCGRSGRRAPSLRHVPPPDHARLPLEAQHAQRAGRQREAAAELAAAARASARRARAGRGRGRRAATSPSAASASAMTRSARAPTSSASRRPGAPSRHRYQPGRVSRISASCMPS